MSAFQTRRRQLRRAIGPAAADALLDAQDQANEIQRFLLMSSSVWQLPRRVWWVLTGRF